MKECDIFRGSKHTLTPPTYFKGVRTSNPQDTLLSNVLSDANDGAFAISHFPGTDDPNLQWGLKVDGRGEEGIRVP